MVHVGEKLVLSLCAESAARAEIGEVVRGGTLPFTLAHNVASPAEVDAVLETARAAGARGYDAQRRDWGGRGGYFTDPDGFRWGSRLQPSPDRRRNASVARRRCSIGLSERIDEHCQAESESRCPAGAGSHDVAVRCRPEPHPYCKALKRMQE